MTIHISPELEKGLEELAREKGKPVDALANDVLQNYLNKQHLDNMLADGLESGEAITVDAGYWKRKKENLCLGK